MLPEPELFADQILTRRETFWWALGLLLLGLVGAFLIVPYLHAWALSHRLVDAVDPARKAHTLPTPRIGGVAFVVPFIAGTALIAVFLHRELVEAAFVREWFVMVAGALAIFVVGLWDDVHPLGAKVKLAAQVVICSLVAVLGFQLTTLSNPFGPEPFVLGWMGWPLAVFWLLSTTNLVNLADGADGMAAGISLIIFVSLALTMWFTAGITMFLLCVLMVGALLGFLIHNFPPARIFMGDGGAYFLGFLIGQVGLAGEHKSTVAAALVVPFLALGVPLIDTVLAILRRAVRGLPIGRADREHVHHRLMELGLSPRRTVLLIYVICVIFCALGLVVFFQRGKGFAVSLGIVFTVGVAAIWALRYFRDVNPWTQLREALGMRRKTTNMVAACSRWMKLAEDYQQLEDYLEAFWDFLEEQGFCELRLQRGDNLPMLVYGREPDEGNFLTIKFPVCIRGRQVAEMELDVANMQGIPPRVWERYATMVRDVITNWHELHSNNWKKA